MSTQPLSKAQRDELRKIASEFAACETHIENVLPGAGMLTTPAATGLRALPRLLADLDAAEAERDEIKTALGVMGATRERALEVAGSQDALEERIDSMSRERDVALKGWSAAEAARDAAAAQRDRAESELDALKAKLAEAGHGSIFTPDEAMVLRAENQQVKAKLAALANAAEVVAENYEECAGFGELDCLAPLYAAIAAARGGATQ